MFLRLKVDTYLPGQEPIVTNVAGDLILGDTDLYRLAQMFFTAARIGGTPMPKTPSDREAAAFGKTAMEAMRELGTVGRKEEFIPPFYPLRRVVTAENKQLAARVAELENGISFVLSKNGLTAGRAGLLPDIAGPLCDLLSPQSGNNASAENVENR